MTADLQQESAQHAEHGAPVEAWDAIAALYDQHVAPGEATWQRPDSGSPDCRRATRSSTSPLGRGLKPPAPHGSARKCCPPTGPRK